ncbi:MAG TPA: hypothetical protein PLM77_18355, partial [Phycisphaerae bacterium]|nr:hypothetical protein [Phycisphaerae bacterium]
FVWPPGNSPDNSPHNSRHKGHRKRHLRSMTLFHHAVKWRFFVKSTLKAPDFIIMIHFNKW